MQEKILECADAFRAIGEMAPGAFDTAKSARFAYEQSKARHFKAILDEIAEKGEKKPTDEAIKAMVTLRVAEEQKAVRDAEGTLEALKMHYQLVRDTLSAYQTAAKFEDTERHLAGAGAYGN
jgi:hypothetical protein